MLVNGLLSAAIFVLEAPERLQKLKGWVSQQLQQPPAPTTAPQVLFESINPWEHIRVGDKVCGTRRSLHAGQRGEVIRVRCVEGRVTWFRIRWPGPLYSDYATERGRLSGYAGTFLEFDPPGVTFKLDRWSDIKTGDRVRGTRASRYSNQMGVVKQLSRADGRLHCLVVEWPDGNRIPYYHESWDHYLFREYTFVFHRITVGGHKIGKFKSVLVPKAKPEVKFDDVEVRDIVWGSRNNVRRGEDGVVETVTRVEGGLNFSVRWFKDGLVDNFSTCENPQGLMRASFWLTKPETALTSWDDITIGDKVKGTGLSAFDGQVGIVATTSGPLNGSINRVGVRWPGLRTLRYYDVKGIDDILTRVPRKAQQLWQLGDYVRGVGISHYLGQVGKVVAMSPNDRSDQMVEILWVNCGERSWYAVSEYGAAKYNHGYIGSWVERIQDPMEAEVSENQKNILVHMYPGKGWTPVLQSTQKECCQLKELGLLAQRAMVRDMPEYVITKLGKQRVDSSGWVKKLPDVGTYVATSDGEGIGKVTRTIDAEHFTITWAFGMVNDYYTKQDLAEGITVIPDQVGAAKRFVQESVCEGDIRQDGSDLWAVVKYQFDPSFRDPPVELRHMGTSEQVTRPYSKVRRCKLVASGAKVVVS